MTAAHKYMDREWLRGLTGAELLLLRLRYGKSVASAVDRELNRRSQVAYAGLEWVPENGAAATPARRTRRSSAA